MGPYLKRVAQSLANRIIPPGGEIPLAVADTHCLAFLENYLRELPSGAALALKAILVAVDLSPVLFLGRPSRFVHLAPEVQDRCLDDWQESRIYWRRMVVVLLKTIFGMGYYSDPKVLAHLGWFEKCGGKPA
jgi:hypothetical protein